MKAYACTSQVIVSTHSADALHNLCRAFAHFVQLLCTLCATALHTLCNGSAQINVYFAIFITSSNVNLPENTISVTSSLSSTCMTTADCCLAK